MTTSAVPGTVEFLDSTDLLDDPVALRDRAAELGYLFFRQLLPREEVLGVRRSMLGVIADHGWLERGSEVMEGIADRTAMSRVPREEIDFCGVGVPVDAYREIQHLEDFHRLSHHPNLLRVYRILFDRPVLPHPRNIARVMIPTDDSVPTPPHQDFIHIQGTKNVWTAWFPLGDCPVDLGGLSVLVGSQQAGVLSYKSVEGAGGLEAYLCDMDNSWAVGDYEAGDLLTFSSQTVHRALPNRYPDRVRLSCDYRYQPADEELHERSLQVHCNVDTWDAIYEGWSDRSLAHYWLDKSLQLSDWDEAIRWQQDRIC
ncbi:MAG TPA: phytanoyl-CoA dioxygenase family protein [Mycobacteriales bacterium]